MTAPTSPASTSLAPTSPPTAIVIGLDSATGLQTARTLAARGIPVVGFASDASHFGCKTRVVERVVETDITSDAFITTLKAMAPEWSQAPVLIPCTDRSVLQISLHRAELQSDYRFVLADHDVIETLLDKVRFTEFAQEHGLPIPTSAVIRSDADASKAAAELTFPVILKPAVKTDAWKDRTAEKVLAVTDAAELLDIWNSISSSVGVCVVQQQIEGDEPNHFTSNVFYNSRSEPTATVVSRKLRQWPLNTGTGTLSEECSDQTVLDATLALFGSVGYRGLGYLEMKRDIRNGEYLIIEPNIGRPTGRSATAERVGVELLLALYNEAINPNADTVNHVGVEPAAGAKWIYARQDLQAAVAKMRRKELTVRQWIRSLRGPKVFAVWDPRDPKPFMFDVVAAAKKIAKRP